MPQLLQGSISATEGLREALEIVTSLKEVNSGILEITAGSISGQIGVAWGRYITGAKLATGEKGKYAVRTLLSLKEGKFCFIDSQGQPNTDLRQSLGIDLNGVVMYLPDFQPRTTPWLYEAGELAEAFSQQEKPVTSTPQEDAAGPASAPAAVAHTDAPDPNYHSAETIAGDAEVAALARSLAQSLAPAVAVSLAGETTQVAAPDANGPVGEQPLPEPDPRMPSSETEEFPAWAPEAAADVETEAVAALEHLRAAWDTASAPSPNPSSAPPAVPCAPATTPVPPLAQTVNHPSHGDESAHPSLAAAAGDDQVHFVRVDRARPSGEQPFTERPDSQAPVCPPPAPSDSRSGQPFHTAFDLTPVIEGVPALPKARLEPPAQPLPPQSTAEPESPPAVSQWIVDDAKSRSLRRATTASAPETSLPEPEPASADAAAARDLNLQGRGLPPIESSAESFAGGGAQLPLPSADLPLPASSDDVESADRPPVSAPEEELQQACLAPPPVRSNDPSSSPLPPIQRQLPPDPPALKLPPPAMQEQSTFPSRNQPGGSRLLAGALHANSSLYSEMPHTADPASAITRLRARDSTSDSIGIAVICVFFFLVSCALTVTCGPPLLEHLTHATPLSRQDK